MERDYYTLGQVILGLRDEYQKHQSDLRLLKDFCDVDEKKVADFRFSVFQPENRQPELHCDYEPKQNKIEKLIANFRKKTGSYIYGKYKAILVTDNNSYHFCSNNYPVHIRKCYSNMDKSFQEKTTEILNSDFSKNIKTKYIEIVNTEINYALTIEQRLINLYIRESNNKFPRSVILYGPREDIISICSFDKKISSELIESVLEIKVPKEKLSNYHIGIIDTTEVIAKPINLQRIQPCKQVEFSIQEEEKQIVLSKVK